MRKLIVIGLVVIVLLMQVCCCNAEMLKVSIGALVERVPYQTFPPPFAAYSQWGGISLSVLFRSVTIDAAISVADLETFTISEHPTLYFVAKVKTAQLGPATLEVSGGLSINTHSSWTAFDVGLGTTITSPIPFTELRGRIFIGGTKGVPGCAAAGAGVGIDVGVFLSIPLL
jgi:hypothetical protein